MKKVMLLILTAALLLSLPACGKQAEAEPEEAAYILSDYSLLPESITGISRCLLREGKLLLCCTESRGEEIVSYAAGMNTDGSGFERLSLELAPGTRLLDIADDSQGGLWGLCLLPMDEETAEYSLCRFDGGGKLLSELPLNSLLDRNAALFPYAQLYLTADKDGRLCLTVDYGKAYCFFFDERGDFLFFLKNDGSPLNCIVTGGGDLALCLREGFDYVLTSVDMEKQSWRRAVDLGAVANIFSGDGSTGCYLYDSAALYACGDSTEQRRLLFDWSSLGLSGGDSHLCPLGEGRFAVISGSFSQTEECSYEFCVVQPGEDRRTVLQMLSMRPDSSILDAVAAFNKSNRQYRVELEAVFPMGADASNDEWNNALMKLSTELISGKVPDIIDLNYLPARDYLQQGFLEDLKPWLDNDPAIERSDYFDNVFEALSMDGKLPYVTSNVLVLTMFAAAELVGEERGWTREEFTAFMESYPQTVERASALWVFERLLCADNPFVDRENSSCSFESEEFISLMELAMAVDGSADNNYLELDAAVGCYFVNAGSVFDVARYNANFGGNTNPIGYPGEGGAVHVLSPANRVGMSAMGENKEGAWQFVRSLLEPRQQEGGGFFPIRKASFEKIMAAAAEGKSMWSQLYPGEIRQGDIDLAYELLNQAAYCLDSTDGLMELVLSEASAYFEGYKTAEEAAQNIQKKVTIYLNEHK